MKSNRCQNNVTFFGFPENIVKTFSKKTHTIYTRIERFYVWEHDVVGHVGWLEFCPRCEGGGGNG